MYYYCIKDVLNFSLRFKMRNKLYKEMGIGNILYISIGNYFFFIVFVILFSFIFFLGGGKLLNKWIKRII